MGANPSIYFPKIEILIMGDIEDLLQIKHMRKIASQTKTVDALFEIKLKCMTTEGDFNRAFPSPFKGGLIDTGDKEFNREVSLTPRMIYCSISQMVDIMRIGGELKLCRQCDAVFIKETINRHFVEIANVLRLHPDTPMPMEDLIDFENLYNRIKTMTVRYEILETEQPKIGEDAFVNAFEMLGRRKDVKQAIIEQSNKPSDLVKRLYDIAGSSDIQWPQ